jgi:malonyl-CoA O-methyltransferase
LDGTDQPLDVTAAKRRIRRAFDRASPSYDAAAVLQTRMRDLLLERLDLTDLAPRVVLDAGAGTGHAARALQRRYPRAQVIALDFSLGMLRSAGRQRAWLRPFARLCADADRLPLADGSVDLVISNCMLPWCDLDAVLGECRRVLAPRGLLSFTTFGPDTLRELRAAAERAAERRPAVAVAGDGAPGYSASGDPQFIDMHDVGDALVRAGFAAPVLDVDRYTLQYATLARLIDDLKATGQRAAAAPHRKGLAGRAAFNALEAAYETFRTDGHLPATYEVVFGQAWTPLDAPRRAAGDGAALVSLEDVRRQLADRRKP